MLFNYKAVDGTNIQREGTVEAQSVDAAITAVQKRGYILVSIDEVFSMPKVVNLLLLNSLRRKTKKQPTKNR